MDTLAFGYILPTTGRIRDFNPLETCAARRTDKKESCHTLQDSSLFYLFILTESSTFVIIPVQRSDEYRSHYGSDADASEMMQHCQTGNCEDGGYRTAKTDFYSGKLIRPHASSHAMLLRPRSNWRSRGL